MVAALEDWCRAAGLPAPAPARARLRVSQGARGLLELAGIDGDSPGFAAARKEYLRLYEATGHRRTRLFAGVGALREKLRAAGTPWGIVTNKPRRYLEPVLRALDLAGARVVFRRRRLRARQAASRFFARGLSRARNRAGRCVIRGRRRARRASRGRGRNAFRARRLGLLRSRRLASPQASGGGVRDSGWNRRGLRIAARRERRCSTLDVVAPR